ncbi:hypothetical protein C0995_006424 [Termitomyces sp. Mi166|nr:hypothetical protein C0995_006424 [Termitomyces sp. Mi166\
MDPVPVHRVQEPDILAEPLTELSLEASNQIMSNALAVQQEQRSLEQMLFLHAVVIPAPPPQLAVVVVTTDPRTPEQYNGLVATQQKAAAASKSKGKIVLTLSDKSNYGESLSEHKRELEEGESAAQRFQRVQYNKKLAAKKANKAKAEAALQHRAINDFSGRIHDGLGKLDESLLNKTMQALLYNPLYRDLQSPIWGDEDKDFVVPRHIPTCFTCVKEDGTTVLRVMHAPDPSQLFDLEQIAQYVLISGRPGLENTWQGIAFDFAYRMHWQTLFGFTLCWALSNGGPIWFHLNLIQVHVPDEMAQNFSDNNALCILLHNQILLDWVDHAYTYGMVYLEQQFHNPTMSLDIFHEIDNKRHQRLLRYGTPPAIPQWDGWREISEDNHYCLLFKHDKECTLPKSPEAKGLYYYIGMDPNQVHLWKHMAAHGLLLPVPTATNIASVESLVVAATTASGPSAPLGPVPVSQEPATNSATGNVTMTLESEEVPLETAGSGP